MPTNINEHHWGAHIVVIIPLDLHCEYGGFLSHMGTHSDHLFLMGFSATPSRYEFGTPMTSWKRPRGAAPNSVECWSNLSSGPVRLKHLPIDPHCFSKLPVHPSIFPVNPTSIPYLFQFTIAYWAEK